MLQKSSNTDYATEWATLGQHIKTYEYSGTTDSNGMMVTDIPFGANIIGALAKQTTGNYYVYTQLRPSNSDFVVALITTETAKVASANVKVWVYKHE